MPKDDIESFCPTSKQDWRKWLEKNHEHKQGVWLIQYKAKTNKPTVTWSEAVDEALRFGWIDSIGKSIDDETHKQFFSKRKPNSTWSKINKDKVAQFIADGRMAPAGLKAIDIAKQNGSWTILDEVEALVIPEDLEQAFKQHDGAKDFFLSLSKSVKKMILQWIVLAKREETRQKRIDEVAIQAGKKMKPKHLI